MVTHISAKNRLRDRSLKNKLKLAGATTLGLLGLGTQALAQDTPNVHLTGDVRSQTESTTHRYGLHLGMLDINGFKTDYNESIEEDKGILLKLSKTIPGLPVAAWYRRISSSDRLGKQESKWQTGLDLFLEGENGTKHYILPAWLTIKNGKIVGSDFIAQGSQNLDFVGAEGINFEYGTIACIAGNDGLDTIAWYTGAAGENLASTIGRDYDGLWESDTGFRTLDGKIGGLVGIIRDPNTDKTQARLMLAQNPGLVTNTTGAVASAEIFVLDVYPTEVNPYLSRIQDKTTEKGGASLDVTYGNEAGDTYGTALVGYKTPFLGGDIGVSVGGDFREGEDVKSALNAHFRTLGTKVFCEARAKEGQSPEFYFRINGLSF